MDSTDGFSLIDSGGADTAPDNWQSAAGNNVASIGTDWLGTLVNGLPRMIDAYKGPLVFENGLPVVKNGNTVRLPSYGALGTSNSTVLLLLMGLAAVMLLKD